MDPSQLALRASKCLILGSNYADGLPVTYRLVNLLDSVAPLWGINTGRIPAGECLFNGEHCSLLEMTLVNPTQPGAGSSTDISLITPHAFNVPTSFRYEQPALTCTLAMR